jgi:hypothetical protein
MDEANKQDIRRRLKKVAALLASDNEHEAAAAQRKADAIMREYRMDQTDLLVAEVEQVEAKAGACEDPPQWERNLAALCAEAYGCDLIFASSFFGAKGKWIIIGLAPSATLAGYALEALATKHRSDRRKYIGTALKRYRNEKNKRAAADAYSYGWVRAIRRVLPKNPMTTEQRTAIDRFKDEQFGKLETMKPRAMSGQADGRHAVSGFDDGRFAELHAGVGTGVKPKALGHLS